MADVFGDLSLFSEFDNRDESEGTFIRYDEGTERSRIIFEGFSSDSESDFDEEQTPTGATEKELGESNGGKEKEPNDGKQDADRQQDSDGKESSMDRTGQSSKSSAQSSEFDRDLAWLNEQLYAAAEADAKRSNVNINQLMFESILPIPFAIQRIHFHHLLY